MSIPFWAALVLYFGYLALKFSAFRATFFRRPTWVELWKFDFSGNEQKRRNARAILWFSILFFLMWVLYLITPGLTSEDSPKDKAALIKLFFLAAAGFNLMARHVIYEEEIKGSKKFTIPLLELVAVIKETPWLMRGTDVVSLIVTVTTLVMFASLLRLLGLIFSN